MLRADVATNPRGSPRLSTPNVEHAQRRARPKSSTPKVEPPNGEHAPSRVPERRTPHRRAPVAKRRQPLAADASPQYDRPTLTVPKGRQIFAQSTQQNHPTSLDTRKHSPPISVRSSRATAQIQTSAFSLHCLRHRPRCTIARLLPTVRKFWIATAPPLRETFVLRTLNFCAPCANFREPNQSASAARRRLDLVSWSLSLRGSPQEVRLTVFENRCRQSPSRCDRAALCLLVLLWPKTTSLRCSHQNHEKSQKGGIAPGNQRMSTSPLIALNSQRPQASD